MFGRGAAYSANVYPASQPTQDPLFTGKERDAETGLDYFGARYMSAAQGRFTSPDAPFNDQNPSDPQSWNLYGYVRNNPLRAIDPDGMKCVDTSNGPADDGTGGGCEAAGVDKNGHIAQQFTVTDRGQMFTEQGGITYLLLDQGRRWPVAEKSMQDATAEMLNAVPAAKLGLAIGKVGLAVGPLAVVIGKDALQHILARHAANTAAQNVSKFAAGLSKDAIAGLINAALKDGVVTQGSKVAFYDLQVGVTIGTNQAGAASSTLRVLVDNVTGKAITAYPNDPVELLK